ncbi:hypothetical protein D3C86_1482740 [compost metagenome]
MDRQIGTRQLGEGLKGRRRVRQTDVDQPVEVTQANRFQPMGRRIEAGSHVVCPEKRAIQLVGPLMVGTDQFRHLPLPRLADDGTTMTTGIVKGADFAIAGLHDHDVVSADAHCHVVARFHQLAGRDRKQPLFVEEMLEIEIIDRLRRIEGLLQGMAGLAAREQFLCGNMCIHGGRFPTYLCSDRKNPPLLSF